ncbi:MAG: Holliday junction resolvase RuvX [Thiohalobacterales bacterium]|nr:Holliday junction resolvase RuvX [Thiohalobacterales bacterium]
MQTLLGFDYGVRRIGVAVGQGVTGTATALCTVAARDGAPDWARINALVAEWRPDALVVGLPRHADGTDSAITRAARRFAQQLEGRYRLPVHLMDERLSSRAAEALQQDDRHGRAGLDAVAARIILQDWLDTENL